MPTVFRLRGLIGSIDRRDGVEQRQRRDRRKLADTKAATHRRNCGDLRTCRRETLDQAPEDLCLSPRSAVREVPRHLLHVGVYDRQVQGES